MENIIYKNKVYSIILKKNGKLYFSRIPFIVSSSNDSACFQIIKDTYFSFDVKLNEKINLIIAEINIDNYLKYNYSNCILNKKYDIFWNINIVMNNDNINKELISIKKDLLTFTIRLYNDDDNPILMLPTFTISY